MPYVVVGVGVAGLATGTAFGLLALNRQDAGRKAASLKDATEARDTGKTFATVSNVSFIVGGALVAGGVVWWVLDGRASKSAPSQGRAGTTRVRVGFGLTDVMLDGVF
jgi:hypothetical protein